MASWHAISLHDFLEASCRIHVSKISKIMLGKLLFTDNITIVVVIAIGF